MMMLHDDDDRDVEENRSLSVGSDDGLLRTFDSMNRPIGVSKPFSSMVQVAKEVVRDIKWQLLGTALYAFIALGKNVMFFPFIRTTVQCSSELVAVDNHQVDWSGSLYCTDRKLVAREAQFLKGLADGMDQAIHCLMLPFLGHYIDCFGRRHGVLIGVFGVVLQCFCYFLASVGVSAGLSEWMLLMGSILQGATGIFMGAIQASVRDVQLKNKNLNQGSGAENPHDSHAFGALQVAQGTTQTVALLIMVVLVISKNLSDYSLVWLSLTLVSALGMGVLYCWFPETLDQYQPWNWRKASPLNLVDNFLHHPSQKWIFLTTFFALLSISSMSVLQAFTIAEYNWTQTYSTVIFTTLCPIAIVSLGSSFILTPRLGPFRVLQLAFASLNIAMFSFMFAPFGPAFVFIGMGFLFTVAGALPALMQVITSLNDVNTGEIVANVGAVALAAVALGNLLFGILFRTFHNMLHLSFIIAFPLILIATYTGSKAHLYSKQ